MRKLFCLFSLFAIYLSASAASEWLYYKHYPWVYDNVSKDWLYLRGSSNGEIYSYRSSTQKWEVFEVQEGEKTWNEQYEEWIQNPEPYGGLTTLEKIKEAKDSGATELNLGQVFPEPTIYISDVTPLSELTNLKKLSLFNTYNVQNIEPLSTLVNLTELTLTSNTISDLSPIEKLTNLEILSLQECGITDDDLESLSKLPSLKELNLRENEILDPSPLAEFPSLKILAFGGSGSDIDQAALPGLAKLSNLEELDLSYSWGYLDDSQKLALEESLPNTTIVY